MSSYSHPCLHPSSPHHPTEDQRSPYHSLRPTDYPTSTRPKTNRLYPHLYLHPHPHLHPHTHLSHPPKEQHYPSHSLHPTHYPNSTTRRKVFPLSPSNWWPPKLES